MTNIAVPDVRSLRDWTDDRLECSMMCVPTGWTLGRGRMPIDPADLAHHQAVTTPPAACLLIRANSRSRSSGARLRWLCDGRWAYRLRLPGVPMRPRAGRGQIGWTTVNLAGALVVVTDVVLSAGIRVGSARC